MLRCLRERDVACAVVCLLATDADPSDPQYQDRLKAQVGRLEFLKRDAAPSDPREAAILKHFAPRVFFAAGDVEPIAIEDLLSKDTKGIADTASGFQTPADMYSHFQLTKASVLENDFLRRQYARITAPKAFPHTALHTKSKRAADGTASNSNTGNEHKKDLSSAGSADPLGQTNPPIYALIHKREKNLRHLDLIYSNQCSFPLHDRIPIPIPIPVPIPHFCDDAINNFPAHLRHMFCTISSLVSCSRERL